MRVMPLRDARDGLAAVVDQAASGEPTIVTRRGKPVAVIVGHDEWQRLTGARSGFVDLLLGFPEGGDLPHDRGAARDFFQGPDAEGRRRS
jgi:prevent-host-death family protein